MTRSTAPAVAIGLGCRRGVAAAPIVALVRATLVQAGLPCGNASLFTLAEKAEEAGLQHAAAQLGLPLVALARERLAAIVTPTQSPRVKEMFGVGSIAEGAALAGAGQGATLAVPRVAREGVTCAIALSCVTSSLP